MREEVRAEREKRVKAEVKVEELTTKVKELNAYRHTV